MKFSYTVVPVTDFVDHNITNNPLAGIIAADGSTVSPALLFVEAKLFKAVNIFIVSPPDSTSARDLAKFCNEAEIQLRTVFPGKVFPPPKTVFMEAKLTKNLLDATVTLSGFNESIFTRLGLLPNRDNLPHDVLIVQTYTRDRDQIISELANMAREHGNEIVETSLPHLDGILKGFKERGVGKILTEGKRLFNQIGAEKIKGEIGLHIRQMEASLKAENVLDQGGSRDEAGAAFFKSIRGEKE